MCEQQTPELALETVKIAPDFIQYIKPENRTEQVWNTVINRDAKLLSYATNGEKHITKAIMEKAIRLHGNNIQYYPNAPEELGLAAVQQNPDSIRFIKNPTRKVQWAAINADKSSSLQHISEPTEEMCIEAVKKNWTNLRYIKNQTEEMCNIALKQDGLAIQFVKNPTDEMCSFALEQNILAIQYIKKQTETMCLEVIRKNPKLFTYIHVRTPEIIELALELHPKNLGVLSKDEQTFERCMKMVDKNPKLVKCIKDVQLKEQIKEYVLKANSNV
jgi:hypothetical protein